KILKLLEIIVPDEVNLLKANNLQDKLPLDPFDAILLAAASAEENIVLVTRDKALISLASKLLEASTPEGFIESTFPCKSF
ncbi:MAG: PIN domain-containing protein, partial [Candidatus Omnitrophica bacterium]|nr:PIN domain-containing protein [Candidatus Omnitrophota bacterium]MBU1524047.1 PIN domain-containing protein [Candidatus Omnitrophota bacterium]